MIEGSLSSGAQPADEGFHCTTGEKICLETGCHRRFECGQLFHVTSQEILFKTWLQTN